MTTHLISRSTHILSWLLFFGISVSAVETTAQTVSDPMIAYSFEGTVHDDSRDGVFEFVKGLDDLALRVGSGGSESHLSIDAYFLPFGTALDFSVQFWLRSVADSDDRFMILSKKSVPDNSLASQKNAGWSFYSSNGTWAWSMGSGDRRITYERDNGEHMPLNDGRWHQLTMTYDSGKSEIRLFYDGANRVTYHVNDSSGFDFNNSEPLVIGWSGSKTNQIDTVRSQIHAGATLLQEMVDKFNAFGLEELASDEFIDLIVDPENLFNKKVDQAASLLESGRSDFVSRLDSLDFSPIEEIESQLMRSPYTVHQARTFMEVALLTKIYSLEDGKVIIRHDAVEEVADAEQLHSPNFDIDNLAIWDDVLSPEEVLDSYSAYFPSTIPDLAESRSSINAGAWNIFHGGKHFRIPDHGWDSRIAIAEIIRRNEADIIMMQETYSSGDFIAAELGYYFATTVDWDYLNQGANISVLSRFPIKELHVPQDAAFMNVAAKVAISETQDLYAMSNWYGMAQFPGVFEFHKGRFGDSDSIPVLFAGDFNAVPESDGGESLAARTLLAAGFTDGFRSLHPDVDLNPGFTHRSGSRIDQMYYRGSGLNNTSTRLVSEWPSGFPSDHYLILSTFELNYSTRD